MEFVRVGGEVIQPSSSVRNLGVILDPSVDMEDHIKKICKTCHFHLTNISKIRSYLDRESTEAIIHAFVTTNLDYCNAILYGLPKVLLNRLQLVQNRAARIVTFTKKYEHITPSLRLLPTFRGQKNRFFFFLTKFEFIILSIVSKRKILKNSKSRRVI